LRKELKQAIGQRKEKIYSYQEASELMNLSIEGLKSRIKRGQIQRVCNGNRPGISGKEINNYFESLNPGQTFNF
jgi:hypothetical protein